MKRNNSGRGWRAAAVGALVAGGAGAGLTAIAGPASAAPGFALQWSKQTSGNQIVGSAPNVVDFGGTQYAVVGDEGGNVYALSLASGAEAPGWQNVSTGNPVDSTPSVNGTQVVVNAGKTNPGTGGTYSFAQNGSLAWHANTAQTPSGGTSGASASAPFATLQGQPAFVVNGLGQEAYEFAASGATLPGWPWFQADSDFATSAVATLNGQPEIVMGGSQTPGLAFGTNYQRGGHIRIVSQGGHGGSAQQNAGQVCDRATDDAVHSSPAVGPFLAGGGVGIVAGTSAEFGGGRDTNAVIAVNPSCQQQWEVTLDGDTSSSPALVDTAGDGTLNVVEGTRPANGAPGSAYVLSGANGRVLRSWNGVFPGGVIGSITSIDVGGGHQDLLVPTGNNGIYVMDPTTGATVANLAPAVGVQNAALVTNDGPGTLGVTIAGYNNGGGIVEHYTLASSASAGERGAWPQFHHDAQLTGVAAGGSTGAPAPPAPPVVQVPCSAPAGGPNGYWEVAGDGGIFTFGNLPFCGSTGAITLNKPVVGMAGTRDGGGYWLVATDGGIFSFGNASFHGSTGAIALNKPIVGMASTPSGNGYWLVASDGGIFNFGDAGFFGSTGNLRLNKPIVGIAATPSGLGYYLVASDGGIFTFGDARYQGSMGGKPLNQPIVAMATDPQTGGYWEIAADGGVFSFDAPFYGSTGNLRLVLPIVAAQATGGGTGYRFEAGDGGVFDFNAPFYGSEGGKALNKPVVGSYSY